MSYHRCRGDKNHLQMSNLTNNKKIFKPISFFKNEKPKLELDVDYYNESDIVYGNLSPENNRSNHPFVKDCALNKIYKVDIQTKPSSISSQTKKINRFLNQIEYNNRKIKPIEMKEGILCIKSPMDTYKSRTLRDYLNREIKTGKSYLNVTYRRFLAINQHQEMLDAGIPDVCYLDKEFNPSGPCITIQAESLHKIKNLPDILVFDECSSFFRQMFSGSK